MAVLRLNDDALLVRPSAAAPELASRVTGAAVPLDDEQAVVVTLLGDGPVEVDELLQRAEEHGVSWSRKTMEAFIEVLERWGLLEVDQPAPRDVVDLPGDIVDVFDVDERTEQDLPADLPPDLAERLGIGRPAAEPPPTEDEDEEAFPRGDTRLTDMSDLFGQPEGPTEKDARALAPVADPLLELDQSEGPTEVGTVPPELLARMARQRQREDADETREVSPPEPLGEVEARPTESGDRAPTLEMPPVAPREQQEARPTESGERAKTIKIPPAAKRYPGEASAEDLEEPPTDKGILPPKPRAPAEDAGEAETNELSLSMPGPRADAPTAMEEEARRSPRPLLRLVPPDGEEEPTNVAAHRRRTSPPGEPSRPGAARPPYPRLIPRWMPKLVPHSKNILLVDPSTNTERLLAISEYQVARMLDGNRSPEQVAEWANSSGLQIQLEDILSIIDRLVSEGVLEPGATRLQAPRPAPRPAPLPRTVSAPTQGPAPSEQTAGSPFADLGASPDSIMESLGFAPMPRRREVSRKEVSRQEASEETAPPAPGQAPPPAADEEPTEALTVAAALVQEDRHEEAEQVLRAILERNPGVIQALAMLELIGGSRAPRPRRWRLPIPWIAGGIACLLLVTGLIVTLAIQVEPTLVLPCRAELLYLGRATSHIAGRVTAVEVQPGMVVKKGQALVRVSNLERKRRMAELRAQIADTKELLRIMRTSGTIADERKQKKIVATLGARLTRMEPRCKDGQPCQRELAKLKEQIEGARRKLKFCEWQAEPDEIAQVAGQLAKMEQELAPLGRKPLEGVIASPWRGLVASVKLAKGQKIDKGAVALRIADAGRFAVVARPGKETVEGAVPSAVRLTLQGAIQTYSTGPTAARRGDALRVEVPAAISNLPQGTCELELSRGKISLLRSWFQ